MKWAKRDLQRLPLEGEEIQVRLNFTEDEIPSYMNIRSVETCEVKAKLSYDVHSNLLMADLKCKGRMILPCSISFETPSYLINAFSRYVSYNFTSSKLLFQFT